MEAWSGASAACKWPNMLWIMVMLTLGTGTMKTLIWCGGPENSAMPTSSRLYLLIGAAHPFLLKRRALL